MRDGNPYDPVELVYSHQRRLDDLENPETAVTQWSIDVMRYDPIGEVQECGRRVGHVRVGAFNLSQDIDWAVAGDELGWDVYHTCSSVLLDPATGAVDDDVALQLPVYPDQLMLLDHVILDPDERGRGLGPKIAAAIMHRLTTSSSLVATYPRPDGWLDMTDKELAAVRTKIEKAWASIGFRPYREGLWLKSMALNRPGWSASAID